LINDLTSIDGNKTLSQFLKIESKVTRAFIDPDDAGAQLASQVTQLSQYGKEARAREFQAKQSTRDRSTSRAGTPLNSLGLYRRQTDPRPTIRTALLKIFSAKNIRFHLEKQCGGKSLPKCTWEEKGMKVGRLLII
jgi:hypothetical protein